MSRNRHSHSQDDGYESENKYVDEDANTINYVNQDRRHDPAEVDQDYLVVGNFVEDSVQQRIKRGEYIDFARLLPCDRLAFEEDNRMEIVNRNGKTYFVPATEAESGGSISNFSRWQQAFRVFSNIYTCL